MNATVNRLLPIFAGPQDAELAVLGACLVDADNAVKIVEQLHVDDFSTPDTGAIFQTVRDCVAEGWPVEAKTISALLMVAGHSSLQPILLRAIDLATTHIGAGIEIIKDGRRRYELRRKVDRLASLASDPAIQADELAAELQAAGEGVEVQAKPDAGSFRFAPISSTEFAAGDYRPTWLVRGVLVEGQPCIIGGPRKALKTGIAIDLAFSIATGSKFLNRFEVPQPRRVAILSGESGAATLQETACRIAQSRGLTLADAGDRLLWQFNLPKLSDQSQLAELARGLRRNGVDALVVDPVYLSLGISSDAGKTAANLFDVGDVLGRFAAVCQREGVTPVLLHHTTKPASRSEAKPELGDLAFAGF